MDCILLDRQKVECDTMLATSSANAKELENAAFLNTQGHLRTLWKICLPLMLSAFSGTLMMFFQRIILATYDTQAMLAATAVWSTIVLFLFSAMSIAMIAEVFVGQYNGAKKWEHVGKPVWQMIWFAILSSFVMIPVGLFGHSLLIPQELAQAGAPYFKWMMIFSPFFPLTSALSAFFIGRGQVKTVTYSVIISNMLNLVLVYLLVFGVAGIIPPLGAKGAAIATGLSEASIAIGLFCIFLNANNRKRFHTHKFHFDKALFIKCIKISVPNTLGHAASTAAWALIMYMMAKRGLAHITVMSIGLSLWALFSFITEGLQKGVTAIAANYIGAKKQKQISEVLTTGLQLQFLLALVLAIPLVLFPHLLVEFFLSSNDTTGNASALRELVETSCRWLWLAYLFDGMAWVIDGVLTAAGDTRFIMFMHSIGTWLLCICPIYLFVVRMEGTPTLTLQLVTVFSFILFSCYFFRYKGKKWDNCLLIN